ncbi:MAG: F0F1 ATP synthase subunit A [Deltaproteobacteria bacterium]|nr:F0F1 ATP synthase subunit A [Deltaproteobacteria bacterium]
MHDIILPTFGLGAHTAITLYLSFSLVVFAFAIKDRLRLIPGKVQSIVEIIIEMFLDQCNDIIGHHGVKFVPFIVTFFIFILLSNALGFVPGLMPPTANLNTTAGLALAGFIATHIIGFREGGMKYLRHFTGPNLYLAPLMVPIEIVGQFARPLSLSLRLFGNMMGHETVVGVLLIIMPIGYPLLGFFTALGVLVAILQAFVFSLLSMAYIGGAVGGEEEH